MGGMSIWGLLVTHLSGDKMPGNVYLISSMEGCGFTIGLYI